MTTPLAAQRTPAKLRPRAMLPRSVSSKTARATEARGRQLQRLVGRRARYVDSRSSMLLNLQTTTLLPPHADVQPTITDRTFVGSKPCKRTPGSRSVSRSPAGFEVI